MRHGGARVKLTVYRPGAPQFHDQHDKAPVDCSAARKAKHRFFTQSEMDRWLTDRGVTLIGADLDESPMAYRRLPEVLAEHAGSIKVLHTLRPFAVAMAGAGEFDPFKD